MLFNIIGDTLSSIFLFALHIENKTIFPKPLSKSEEEECFIKMGKGDACARHKLIEHNLRLVAHIIKKYYSNLKDQDELISIGTIGLIKAVSTFDYLKGNRFATYASRCIENEILMYFRSRKKSQGDVYIDEPIDTDKDGNQFSHSLYTLFLSFPFSKLRFISFFVLFALFLRILFVKSYKNQ